MNLILFQPAKRQRLESDLFTKGQQWDEIELKFDDGQSLYTSKGFLACVSPVFDRMFRTECKEVMDNCIEMKGKDREMFKKILLRLHPNSQKPLAGMYAELSKSYLLFSHFIAVFFFRYSTRSRHKLGCTTIQNG